MIYDLPKCFMMTWEELMGMPSVIGYDIWSEDATKAPNYPTWIWGETLPTLIKWPNIHI